MKVIFLDIDGVLNCRTTQEVIWRDNGKEGFHGVEDGKIKLLKKIVRKTGAVIVLHSSWRLNKDESVFHHYSFFDDLDDEEFDLSPKKSIYKYLRKHLSANRLKIYDSTPFIGHWSRPKEIHVWLKAHSEVTNYVILDDEKFSAFKDYGLIDHVVFTSYDEGLTEAKANEAIDILIKE